MTDSTENEAMLCHLRPLSTSIHQGIHVFICGLQIFDGFQKYFFAILANLLFFCKFCHSKITTYTVVHQNIDKSVSYSFHDFLGIAKSSHFFILFFILLFLLCRARGKLKRYLLLKPT